MTAHRTRIMGIEGGSDFVLFYFALNMMFWPEINTINNIRCRQRFSASDRFTNHRWTREFFCEPLKHLRFNCVQITLGFIRRLGAAFA